ncbi:MAG: TetR/AcrR family transcriptional regulator [Deltaproteobacteria bacterium]|nr:MAG: TetR/AcrR family transcriptional regulator [Deltaproteobacteria bacterium]
MARYRPGHKEQTSKKIVDAAARLFREKGVAGARVEDVMGAVGLTVGGFYRHYDSKEKLLAQAISRAFETSRALVQATPEGLRGREWLRVAAALYLNEQHRDNVGGGCPLPALSGDIARASDRVRRHFEDELKAIVAAIAEHLEGTPEEREAAAWQFCALGLGALLLARTVADPELSSRILDSARAAFEDGERSDSSPNPLDPTP